MLIRVKQRVKKKCEEIKKKKNNSCFLPFNASQGRTDGRPSLDVNELTLRSVFLSGARKLCIKSEWVSRLWWETSTMSRSATARIHTSKS